MARIARVDTADVAEISIYWPQFLPDRRHFICTAWSPKPENRAIYVGSIDSSDRTRIMAAESRAMYVPPGYLLFHRQGTLFAQAFDAARLAFESVRSLKQRLPSCSSRPV